MRWVVVPVTSMRAPLALRVPTIVIVGVGGGSGAGSIVTWRVEYADSELPPAVAVIQCRVEGYASTGVPETMPVAGSMVRPAGRLGAGEDVSRATGIYRICEQALLNAAVHGHSTECSIQVGVNDHDELVLEIQDNGVGLSPSPGQPGMGSTVISAWTETLRGRWSLQPAEVGMTLTAVIPAE